MHTNSLTLLPASLALENLMCANAGACSGQYCSSLSSGVCSAALVPSALSFPVSRPVHSEHTRSIG